MFEKFMAWVAMLFGKKPKSPPEAYGAQKSEEEYKKIDNINFALMFGQRLANIAFADSTQEITGADGQEGGKRAEIVREVLDWAFKRARKISAQVMATGGRLIVPYVADGQIKCDLVEQERLYILETAGEVITSAAILADSTTVNDKRYYRWVGYTLINGSLQIRNRITDDAGRVVPIADFEAWADLPDEYVIQNADKLPFAFLRCPGDNRRTKELYGTPITYGSESIIKSIRDQMRTIAREYSLTRPMLGLDATLWRRRLPGDGSRGIDDLRRTVQDSDDPFIPVDGYTDDQRVPWMIYAPAIRDSAMYNRLDRLFELLEKSVGTSRGILTARETANATATEIRAANHDTMVMVDAVRGMWADAMDDLADAVDMLAEHFGLSPAGERGDYAIQYDWDMSLFESAEETFQQLTELQDRGAVSLAELRQWVRGGTLEEAQNAVDEISARGEHKSAIDNILARTDVTDDVE